MSMIVRQSDQEGAALCQCASALSELVEAGNHAAVARIMGYLHNRFAADVRTAIQEKQKQIVELADKYKAAIDEIDKIEAENKPEQQSN